MRWDERNDASKKRRVTATRERIRHTTHWGGQLHHEVEADEQQARGGKHSKARKTVCALAQAGPSRAGGGADKCSQPGSGKPGTPTTLVHAHHQPMDKQPQKPGQPTSQRAGSQGARAL